VWYILSQFKERNKYKGNEYIIKTIVTSDLLEKIAEAYNVEYVNVLTGFKFFAKYIREMKEQKNISVAEKRAMDFYQAIM